MRRHDEVYNVLTQTQADTLIAMRKTFVSPVVIPLPPGADATYDLIGDDRRERFLLDLWRGTMRLAKLRFQTRARKVIVLVRLDIHGAPHTNPDGARLGGTHLHLYREGYEGKWAYTLDPHEFSDSLNVAQTFGDLFGYCNVQNGWQFR